MHVADARPVSEAAYAISAKVTRLTFGPGERAADRDLRRSLPAARDGRLRGERAAPKNNLPLPEPLSGKILVLSGIFPGCERGRPPSCAGTCLTRPRSPSRVPSAESVIIAAAPASTRSASATVILTKPLARTYARHSTTTRSWPTVVVTQGETLPDEILGSGNGAPFQTYPLKKTPLTYLPSSDPEGLAAVEHAPGERQRRPLGGAAGDHAGRGGRPGLRHHARRRGADGGHLRRRRQWRPAAHRPRTTSTLATARVSASRRVGAGGISRLIDSLPGVQKVDNPLPAGGGAERETSDRIRVNAPASVRTFGRAVSADDYAALALSYPGVAKASATWVLRDPATLRRAAPALRSADGGPGGSPAPGGPAGARSGCGPSSTAGATRTCRCASATLIRSSSTSRRASPSTRHGRQTTLDAARAALDPETGFFSLERLGFEEHPPQCRLRGDPGRAGCARRAHYQAAAAAAGRRPGHGARPHLHPAHRDRDHWQRSARYRELEGQADADPRRGGFVDT